MPIPKIRTLPKAGTEFVKKYKKKTYGLKVVRGENGIRYQLNGKIFSSPSAAAKSITGTEVNGWKFWKID